VGKGGDEVTEIEESHLSGLVNLSFTLSTVSKMGSHWRILKQRSKKIDLCF
jgi:hypothetical protein